MSCQLIDSGNEPLIDANVRARIENLTPYESFQITLEEKPVKFSSELSSRFPVSDSLQRLGFLLLYAESTIKGEDRSIIHVLQDENWTCVVEKEFKYNDNFSSSSTLVKFAPSRESRFAVPQANMNFFKNTISIYSTEPWQNNLPYEILIGDSTRLRYSWRIYDKDLLHLRGEVIQGGRKVGNFLPGYLNTNVGFGYLLHKGDQTFTYAYTSNVESEAFQVVTFFKERENAAYRLDTVTGGIHLDLDLDSDLMLLQKFKEVQGSFITTYELVNLNSGNTYPITELSGDLCETDGTRLNNCLKILSVSEDLVLIGNTEPLASIRRSEI